MKIRQRTKNLLYAGGIGALAVTLLAAIIFYLVFSNLHEKQANQIQKYQKELTTMKEWASEQAVGYVLKDNIEAGTTIYEDMLEEVYLPPKSTAKDILTKDEALNQIAKVDMTAGTLMIKSILSEDEPLRKDVRHTEYDFITLPSTLKKDDYVDVRIQFPDGSDYVLFSKKKATDVKGDKVWFQFDEEEILTMSSAIVDAYYESAVIYSLAYVEPELQSASVVTYPVKENVMNLILDSPNVVNLAMDALKARGRGILENHLQTLTDEERQIYQTMSDQQKVRNKEKTDAEKKQAQVDTTESINQEDVFNESVGGE